MSSQEKQSFYQRLFESIPEAILVIDQKNQIKLANKHCEQLFGYTQKEMLGEVLEFLLPAPLQKSPPSKEQYEKAGESELNLIRIAQKSYGLRKNGSEFLVKLGIYLLPNENEKWAVISVQELSSPSRQEKLLRSVLDSSTIGIVYWDSEGHIIDANDAFLLMLGYNHEDLYVGRLLWNDITPNDYEHLDRKAFKELAAWGVCTPYEKEYIHRTGLRVPVLVSSTTFQENKEAGLCFVIDLSEQKEAESALRKSEERYRSIMETALENLTEGIWVIDANARTNFINQNMASMLGYRPEEILGRSFFDFFAKTSSQDKQSLLKDLQNQNPSQEDVCLQRKNNSFLWTIMSTTPVKNQAGDFVGMLAICTDITERKLTEETHAQLAAIVQSSNDAMLSLHSDGVILNWNPAAERIYGYSEVEALGSPFSMLLPEKEVAKSQKLLETVFMGNRINDLEMIHRRKDAQTVDVSLSLYPVQNKLGHIIAASYIAQDLTEQKQNEKIQKRITQLEEQNRQVQIASRLKSEFLANMSHELRTPLNAIIGFAELMYDGHVGEMSEEHKEFTGDILNSGHHLLSLINDILDLAKIEAGKMEFRPEVILVTPLVEGVIEILRAQSTKKQIDISIEIDSQLKQITIDPVRVKQILYNYLSNALKFTPEQGKIFVRIFEEDADFFRLEVEDTGIGISKEDIGRIFTDFHQLNVGTTHTGTGLGLALTRKITHAMGGRVGVRSRPKEGSLFFAILPKIAAPLHESREMRLS